MAKYLYTYHEERGEFTASVDDASGNELWSVRYPDLYHDETTGELVESSTIFEDGFMRNADDVEGLEKYLKSLDVLNEDDILVTDESELEEEEQGYGDDILEFTIPNWALSSLINGDNSGNDEEDDEKLERFVKETIATYGNANFMLPYDKDLDLGFCHSNDIDNLGNDCSMLLLRPSKNEEAHEEAHTEREEDLDEFEFEEGGVNEPFVFQKVNVTIKDIDMGGDVIYKQSHWFKKDQLDKKTNKEIGEFILKKYGMDYGNTYKYVINRTKETKEKMAAGGATQDEFEVTFTFDSEDGDFDSRTVLVKATSYDDAVDKATQKYSSAYKGFKIENPKKMMRLGGNIEEKIKGKLKGTFELPMEVAVYVPSTYDKDKIISRAEFKRRVDEVDLFLSKAFGGFSGTTVEGGFISDEKKLIQEDVVRVASFGQKEGFESNFKKLIVKIKYWCEKWQQESIGLEFEGDMFYVSAEAKYARGGAMEKGGLMGDVHSITDKLLSQKIQIFLNKVKPFKFYYIDTNTLYVGFDESHTTDASEKFYKEATSSKEFFDADSVSMEYKQDTHDTIYTIKLKKEVRYADGGVMAEGGAVENKIDKLYKKSNFINDDFNWKLKLLEMLQDMSVEAYNIYQTLTKQQKEEVLQEQYEVDNDMGSDGDGDIETSKENIEILLEDAKNGKKYADGGMMAKGGQFKVNKKYTHFAVNKKTNKIVNGWETISDVESLKYYAKGDLEDMDLKPSDYSILTAAVLKKRGIDPYSWDSWAKAGEFSEGGEVGVDLFEDYENIPPKVQKILDKYEDDFVNGSYEGLTKAVKELEAIGYTFDFYLDGVAYDLRKIGQKGKVEVAEMEKFVLKTVNGNFMSEIYTMNGLDFETMYQADAKKFDTKKEAEDFIKEAGFADDFIFVVEAIKAELADDMQPFKKGGVTFDDKVKAISKGLKGSKVAPKYKKEYGKTYDKSEAVLAAKRIAGAMRQKGMGKMKDGGGVKDEYWDAIKTEVLDNCKKVAITDKGFIKTLLKFRRRVLTCQRILSNRAKWKTVQKSYAYKDAEDAIELLNDTKYGRASKDAKYAAEWILYCTTGNTMWEANLTDWLA